MAKPSGALIARNESMGITTATNPIIKISEIKKWSHLFRTKSITSNTISKRMRTSNKMNVTPSNHPPGDTNIAKTMINVCKTKKQWILHQYLTSQSIVFLRTDGFFKGVSISSVCIGGYSCLLCSFRIGSCFTFFIFFVAKQKGFLPFYLQAPIES